MTDARRVYRLSWAQVRCAHSEGQHVDLLSRLLMSLVGSMSSFYIEQKLVVAVYLRQGSIISAWWRTAALLAAIGIAAVEISGVAGRKSGSQGEVSSPLSLKLGRRGRGWQ